MKKVLFCLCIPLVMVFTDASSAMAYEREIKTLSSALAENINKRAVNTVAVVDFTDLQGNVTELGRFLAEELSGELSTSGQKFEIVDRAHLKTILAEHKLSVSGLVDPNTVKKLGQISGVGGIVTGSVTPFGESVRLSCKLIATDTAKVIGAAKVDIPKTKAIEELLGKGIETEATQAPAGKSQSKPAQGKESINVVQKAEASGFVFELNGCSNSGGIVRCTLNVTSMGEDKQLMLHNEYPPVGSTRIIDESGEESEVNHIKLGNREWKHPGNKYGSRAYLSAPLVKNTPVKTILSFNGISSEASSLSLLEIIGKNVKVQFRNIPLTKSDALATSPPLKGKRR